MTWPTYNKAIYGIWLDFAKSEEWIRMMVINDLI